MTYEKEYKLITEKFGKVDNINMCIEECAELIQALSKIRRLKEFPENHADKKEQYMHNLYEEIADATITIELMIHSENCREQVDEIRQQKIDRIMNRFFKDKK